VLFSRACEANEQREFLLEAVHAKRRTRGILPQGNLAEALEQARAITEDALPEKATAQNPESLRKALEHLASEDLQGLHERFEAAGLPHWLDYLSGRLRLLALPTPFLEHAAQHGIGASRLFALKQALDTGADMEQVEALLEKAPLLEPKQLIAELGVESQQPQAEPEVQQVLGQLRRLPKLLKQRISHEPDPAVLERLKALLAELEKVLEG